MKKRILCLILTVLMLVGITPGSVLAAELIEALDNSLPVAGISPKYYYDGSDLGEEFRAFPIPTVRFTSRSLSTNTRRAVR